MGTVAASTCEIFAGFGATLPLLTRIIIGISHLMIHYGLWMALGVIIAVYLVRGWVASEIWNKPHRFAQYHQLVLDGLAQGHLKPVIAKTFPLAQIAAAHRYLESNQQIGKIVVTVK